MKITNGTYLRRALFATAATVAITAAGTAIAAAPPAIPGTSGGAKISQTGDPGGAFGTEATPSASSTISVTGAQTYIRDVDVKVLVPHMWSADLDLTLEHNGITIPLTTDNPGDGGGQQARSFPNAFANTLFDDDGGITPSATGIEPGATGPSPSSGAKDPTGLYLTAVPEGPLGHFIGMNPNGTWTLTATDDSILDEPAPDPLPDDWEASAFFTGSLNGWTLDIETLPGPPPASQATSHTQNTGAGVADGATVVSKLTVAGAQRYLTDVDLTTNIQHATSGDLEVRLTSPAGTTIWISNNRGEGSGTALVGTKFDDSASSPFSEVGAVFGGDSYMPEGAMAAFIGENPNGVWTLTVQDTAPGDGGQLNNWKLDIKSTGGAPPPPPGPGVLPSSIPGDDACKTVPKRRTKSGSGRVPFKASALKIQQNQISVAILRLNAINGRAKGGFLARDLCGYSFGSEDFASTVTWASGAAVGAAAANPRPLKFPKFKKKGKKFNLTKKQAAINDTLANFVLAKAIATRKRYKALGGGDLRPGAVTPGKLHKGLVVTGGKGGTAAGPKSKLPKFTWKKTKAGSIKKLNAAYLLRTQRKSQRAIRILNSITDEVRGGLKGSNFKNKQAPGSKLG